jgi:hypothetical protein
MSTVWIGVCALIVLAYCGYLGDVGRYFGMPRRSKKETPGQK